MLPPDRGPMFGLNRLRSLQAGPRRRERVYRKAEAQTMAQMVSEEGSGTDWKATSSTPMKSWPVPGMPATTLTLVINLPGSTKPTNAISPTGEDVPAPASVMDWELPSLNVTVSAKKLVCTPVR